jgi:intracellular sulfur oxidation DsrE/DsrF family protein
MFPLALMVNPMAGTGYRLEVRMKYVNVFLSFLTAAALVFASNAMAGESERYGKQKVVYHINYDDPKAQAGALRNIQNHINAVGAENLDLKVVMHGKGLTLLLSPDAVERTKLKHGNATDDIQAKISGLKDQGVGFQVCSNTLRGKTIDFENDLYDVEKGDIVPSGVAELARLQAMGYTYIKP